MTLGNDNGTDGQTDRRTDRQTDGQSATQYAAPPREEGRIISQIELNKDFALGSGLVLAYNRHFSDATNLATVLVS